MNVIGAYVSGDDSKCRLMRDSDGYLQRTEEGELVTRKEEDKVANGGSGGGGDDLTAEELAKQQEAKALAERHGEAEKQFNLINLQKLNIMRELEQVRPLLAELGEFDSKTNKPTLYKSATGLRDVSTATVERIAGFIKQMEADMIDLSESCNFRLK